ncbi:MAG: hypothetical protein WA610_11805, partial [Thermodesulfovibrionales bacterium]
MKKKQTKRAQRMKIHSRFGRFLMGIFFVFTLIGSISRPAQGGTVVVKPGQFDHFTVQLPDKAVAGESFIAKVQAYDLNNNLITNFTDSGKEFRIDAGGSAVVQPVTLSVASFSGGTANISINSRKAEKIVLSIREAGGSVPVISREILVVPNKLEHFILQAPASVRAGAKFDIRIIAKDLFDNTVDDVEIGRNLKVTASGTASPGMIGGSGIDFKNGTAVATFVSEKAGSSFIELQELTGGSKGRSNEVAVTPAALSLFKVQAPKTAVAGEAFDLIISAFDAFDNLINTYASSGAGGATLMTTGNTKIEPSSLAASDFKNGQAVVKAIYEKAEDIAVTVKDVNSEKYGKTGDIQVTNAAPDHFVVVTPDSAVSGQRFKIKIEAYDRFNNIVRNYNLAGNEIVLSTSGTSFITPSVILPTEFISGIAVVDVLYDRAESFTISAKMIGEKRRGKMTVTEKEQPRETSHQRTMTQVVEKPRQPERTPVEPRVEKTVEKPEPKKSEVRKPEPNKTEPKKTESKKEVASKTEEKKKAVEKVAQKAVEQKKEKPVQPEVKKAEQRPIEQKQERPKQPEKAVEEAKPAKPVKPVELAKKEEKKLEPKKPEPKKLEPKPELKPELKTDQLTAVSKIAAIEAKNKAMLVINLS